MNNEREILQKIDFERVMYRIEELSKDLSISEQRVLELAEKVTELWNENTRQKNELEALRKRNTLMKVINIEYNEYGLFGDCPNCKANIPSSNYCQDCGQKLDWSDESE